MISWYSSPGCGVPGWDAGTEPCDNIINDMWLILCFLCFVLPVGPKCRSRRKKECRWLGGIISLPAASVEYAAMKPVISTGVFFAYFSPVSSTTIMFLSNLGTDVVLQVGNGHIDLGIPEQACFKYLQR